jgi:hypothetical protein
VGYPRLLFVFFGTRTEFDVDVYPKWAFRHDSKVSWTGNIMHGAGVAFHPFRLKLPGHSRKDKITAVHDD